MAALPNLLLDTKSTAASKQQQQQQQQQGEHEGEQGLQQQQVPKQQQQLQQLDSILKSVNLEEKLLQELKNLKLGEQAMFIEDAKRKDQRFVDCKP